MHQTNLHNTVKTLEKNNLHTKLTFQFETPNNNQELLLNSDLISPEHYFKETNYINEEFNLTNHILLADYLKKEKLNDSIFITIFSNLFFLTDELIKNKIQLKLIYEDFIYINIETKKIKLLNSNLLNDFCNDPHDIYFNKIAFKETIQFATKLIYKCISTKSLIDSLDFSHDKSFNKQVESFLKCKDKAKSLIEFLFEANINSHEYTETPFFHKRFKKIFKQKNLTLNNSESVYSFTTKPINKKIIIQKITKSINLIKENQEDYCYFIEGDLGSGKKYIQQYVTSNASKETHLFTLNIAFNESSKNDYTPFLNCFKWFIKQCIANSEIVFFNNHFFSTFSRNDQVLALTIFPEIQFYLKEFPIPTSDEKSNALSYNMNIVLENIVNLFILKTPLLINIYNTNIISKNHTKILKNLFAKLNNPKIITIAYSNNRETNTATENLHQFLKSEFDYKIIKTPLFTKENTKTFIKQSYNYSFENETEFINNLFIKTKGNSLFIKHLLILLHSNNAIWLENNKFNWSKEKFNTLIDNSTITQHIQKNISSLNEESKNTLKILASFENNITINQLLNYDKNLNLKKPIKFLLANHFLIYEQENNNEKSENRKLKFGNESIFKYSKELSTKKEKKEIRFRLGLNLFKKYNELNFENTMLMTFCISENFNYIYSNYNIRFLFNHVLTLSKHFRNKGNYTLGNYLLTNILKTIKPKKIKISQKELKFLYTEKAYHLHFLKKYKISHRYFIESTNLSTDLSEKLSIGTNEVLLFNKKRDFLNGYKVTRNYLKLVNINHPKNPNNNLFFTLKILSNLVKAVIKLASPIKPKTQEIPKTSQKIYEIILSNLEMAIGRAGEALLLCYILQAFNLSVNYKRSSSFYYIKTSILLFLTYANIIYLPYKLFKTMKPPKIKKHEDTIKKTEFVANSFLKAPFVPFNEMEEDFNKQIIYFMSRDNMYFTYAAIFSKLFLQYLNGTALTTLYESITKYYEWAKNYMQPISLFENYLDFFTTLHKNKLGFENRITTNFSNNDKIFKASAYVKLIIYYFYTNQYNKSLKIIPKTKLNASTGPFFYTFEYYTSLTYGFLAVTTRKKSYIKKFNKFSKRFITLSKYNEFQFSYISTLLKLINCLINEKVDKAFILYNKIPLSNLNTLAIANEIIGIYFKNKKINIQSNMYFTKALNDYAKWGNNLKYNALKQELKTTFPELNLDYFNTNKKVNNLLSCIKVSHSIANEKETPTLIKSVLTTIKDHVNASKISCILSNDEDLHLYSQLINNTYSIYNNSIRNHKNKLPTNLISYAFKTKEVIKLTSLQNSISFYDNYINLGSQNSAICIPLINQDSILGVLYIERNQRTPFTNDDTLFLNIICTHVTNSLKNSMLYEKNKALINNLEEKVKDQINAIQLKEQEKLKSEEIAKKALEQAAYATLTRGIAHEIRNPMAIMLSGIELIQENIENKDKTIEYLNAVKESILRLKNITTTMLRYGKSVAEEKSVENINTLLEDAIIVSSAECKKRQIKLNKELTTIPDTIIDPNSISQVFLNLILNSIEAIKRSGTITVATNIVSVKSIPMIEISITDTGVGISKSNITKIFNPFYTSKYENTGLGLSIVLKIINEHNGKLDVDSEINKYTTFKISLPIKNN